MEMWDRPILVMLGISLGTWRVLLLLHPGIRRWRASRDLAYAYALEQARTMFQEERKRLDGIFGRAEGPQ